MEEAEEEGGDFTIGGNYKNPPIIKTSTYTTIAMQNAETFCMAIVVLTERDISLIILTGRINGEGFMLYFSTG